MYNISTVILDVYIEIQNVSKVRSKLLARIKNIIS
jgi:hypothetical protein